MARRTVAASPAVMKQASCGLSSAPEDDLVIELAEKGKFGWQSIE